MTLFLIDVASYQGDLSADDVARAGVTGVNLKISHGLGVKAVHPEVAGWVEQGRTRRWMVGTFHYLTADASGAAQARHAWQRMADLGLLYGTAHTVDVEAEQAPTLAQVRDYLTTMTGLLGRPVAVYTGDWWWATRSAWNVADLTPYLWAAPNVGYLPGYPGDSSARWTAGYGGWPTLSIMQYAADVPLTFPDGTSGSIDVSKSALRDATVWHDLTTGRPGMTYAPDTLKAARTFYINTLKAAGFAIDPLGVGIVGDDSHGKTGTSYHLGKDALLTTAYSIIESPRDKAGLTNAAAALDLGKFSITVGGKAHNLRTFSIWLVAQCKAGTADTADIREVIYSPDGAVVKRWDRLGKRTTGDDSHLEHTHESWFRDSEGRDKTAHLRRYFTEIGVLEDDVSTEDFLAYDPNDSSKGIPNPFSDAATNKTISPRTALYNAVLLPLQIKAQLNALTGTVRQMADQQGVDTAALQAAIGQVDDEVLGQLAAAGRSDQETAEVLLGLLGPDRARSIGALLSAAG